MVPLAIYDHVKQYLKGFDQGYNSMQALNVRISTVIDISWKQCN